MNHSPTIAQNVILKSNMNTTLKEKEGNLTQQQQKYNIKTTLKERRD
jgi:hypothetical protein